ncbi:hypothetical protein [Paenibacillus sp. HJGM_3]|uniref:hypothetical protein n=1 Tax=Paenibacillus sp. HJGM_3 TaxID=3379816 RepID=UPI00385898BC
MNIVAYHQYGNGHIAVDAQNRFVGIVKDVPCQTIPKRKNAPKSLVERQRKVV